MNRLREYVSEVMGDTKYRDDAVRLSYIGHVYLITMSRDWAGYNERKERLRSLGYIRLLAVL